MRRHEAIFAALHSTEVKTFPMVTSSGTILGTARMGVPRHLPLVGVCDSSAADRCPFRKNITVFFVLHQVS
jgi:hypothetical protein